MGIKIGDLNVSKQVKRMYVGVDGKAHRVVKVYAKAKTSSVITKAGPVYKDEQALQVSARFNLGNMSPALCSVRISPDTGEFLVSGTFKDKFLLSELSVSKTGMSVQDTGRSVSLGSTTMPFNSPSDVSAYGSNGASGQIFLFSGSVLGKVFMKRVSPYDMAEEGGVTNYGFSTTASTLASGPQDVGPFDATATWPLPYFMSVNAAGNSGIVAAYSENGTAAKTYTFSGYKTSQRSCRTYDYSSVIRKLLVTNASTGKDVRILGLASYFYNNGALSKIDTCGSYAVKMPSSYVTTNLYLGAAFNGSAIDSGGSENYESYITTVSCQDGSKRYHKLIVDSASGNSSNLLNFDVKEYTEEHDLPADSSRAAYQKWQVLGVDGGCYIYVLSTAKDEVKILKFVTSATEITKVAEYDTGIRLDANTVVQDVVPVAYAYSDKTGDTWEKRGDSYIPAFIVTRNNEYNELVIVSRSLIV